MTEIDMKKIREQANAQIKQIIERREEVIEAFIAKYSLQPEEVVIVEQRDNDLTLRTWVEMRHEVCNECGCSGRYSEYVPGMITYQYEEEEDD